MLIQVNTGRQTGGSADLKTYVQEFVEGKFRRFAERITRVEVHLNDENTAKKAGGNDKRCQVEVRLAGLQPLSVTHHADSHDQALDGAVGKMHSLIDTTLGKHQDR